MRFVAVAFAVLTTGLLAGCSGSDEAEPDPTTPMHTGPHGANTAGSHILAPEWAVGDHWTLTSDQGGTFNHVVSGESGGDWIMDTDNPDIAFFDAQGDISFLGKVRKTDLAGSQGTDRVEFLRFPLQSNMSWSTTWDGDPTMIHVSKVADDKADLLAMRADGTTYATYVYDAEAGYFSRFTFFAPDGTTVGFEWSLQSSGSGFSGQLVRWSLTDLFSTHGAIPTGTARDFQVAPGFTDIYVSAELSCTAGSVTIAVGTFTGPAEDRGYSAIGPCPLQDSSAYPVAAPAAAEEWGALVNGAPTTTGTLDLTVWGRTQTLFAPGEAPA